MMKTSKVKIRVGDIELPNVLNLQIILNRVGVPNTIGCNDKPLFETTIIFDAIDLPRCVFCDSKKQTVELAIFSEDNVMVQTFRKCRISVDKPFGETSRHVGEPSRHEILAVTTKKPKMINYNSIWWMD